MGRIRRNSNFVVRYLDSGVFEAMLALGPGFELHDRAIAATAQIYGCPVITRDRQLSATINTVW
jgi:hypothetical protein